MLIDELKNLQKKLKTVSGKAFAKQLLHYEMMPSVCIIPFFLLSYFFVIKFLFTYPLLLLFRFTCILDPRFKENGFHIYRNFTKKLEELKQELKKIIDFRNCYESYG